MGIVKRPAARARRPRLTPEENAVLQRGLEYVQDQEAAALRKLDERLGTILEGVKDLPADPPKPPPITDAEIEERVARLPTTTLLDLFLQDHRIHAGPGKIVALGGVPVEESNWGRQARAVRAEIDHRIPRRRA